MPSTFDFTTFPVLETERLILREIAPADAPGIFRIRGDYEVTKYNSGAPYTTIDQARDLIKAIAASYHEKKEIRWGITLKGQVFGPDSIIGMCGYNYWSRRDFRGSVGYDLAHAYWGRGIMPEALQAMLAFGFERMNLNRIEADASVYNTASIRVLEKLGFQQEGIQREQYFEDGAFHDLALFALLKHEYSCSSQQV
jgi:[ribosomal protein S5]-alanine N-acetyltransferase